MTTELEQRMEDLHKRIVLAKFNQCHNPPGAGGGRFCAGGGKGSGAKGSYMPFTPKVPPPPPPPKVSTVPGGKVKVVVGPGVSSNYTKSVEKRLAAIPDEYRVVPQQTIHITSTPIMVARGTQAASGVFRPEPFSGGRGSIDVSTRTRVTPGTFGGRSAGQVAEVAAHEYGHAVDFHFGKQGGFRSDQADFRTVFNTELAKAGKAIQSQFWGTHHREAFAELYKVASGGRITSIGSRSVLQQRFPKSLSKIQEIVTGRTGG